MDSSQARSLCGPGLLAVGWAALLLGCHENGASSSGAVKVLSLRAGPDGGSLREASGWGIVVPAGTLREETTLEVWQLDPRKAANQVAIAGTGDAVALALRFEPDGLRPASPVTVRVPIAALRDPSQPNPDTFVPALVTEQGALETAPGLAIGRSADGALALRIPHFSIGIVWDAARIFDVHAFLEDLLSRYLQAFEAHDPEACAIALEIGALADVLTLLQGQQLYHRWYSGAGLLDCVATSCPASLPGMDVPVPDRYYQYSREGFHAEKSSICKSRVCTRTDEPSMQDLLLGELDEELGVACCPEAGSQSIGPTRLTDGSPRRLELLIERVGDEPLTYDEQMISYYKFYLSGGTYSCLGASTDAQRTLYLEEAEWAYADTTDFNPGDAVSLFGLKIPDELWLNMQSCSGGVIGHDYRLQSERWTTSPPLVKTVPGRLLSDPVTGACRCMEGMVPLVATDPRQGCGCPAGQTWNDATLRCECVLGPGAGTKGQIVNVSASQNRYLDNPVVVRLAAGQYDVVPVGVAQGGAYNAWSPWISATRWWSVYYAWTDDFLVRRGEHGAFYATDVEALAHAESSSFVLASEQAVSFSVADSLYDDNVGGMSLLVSSRCPTGQPAP